MRRAVGLSIAAVVLSVTLGVLIGLVIHTGMSERADHSGSQPGTSAPVTDASGSNSLPQPPSDAPGNGAGQASPTLPDPWSVEVTPVTDDPTGSPGAVRSTDAGGQTADTPDSTTLTATSTPSGRSPGITGHTPSTASRTSATGHHRASRTPSSTLRTPTIISSTVGGPGTGSTGSTGSGAASRSTGVPASTVTAGPGSDRPDRPCGTLGEKSAMRSGATLFCQHDQTDGSLRWRAVTNGGGCLNQTMTGTGLDGHRYACRLGVGGLNHWKRAG